MSTNHNLMSNQAQNQLGDNQHMLTVDEVADLLRVSRSTAYNLVRAGEIPVARFGRLKRVPRQAFENYLARKIQTGI